jgi:hypothetical protein
MNGKTWIRRIALVLLLVANAAQQAKAAPTIWNGPLTNFTHVNFSNPSLAANQDRLTSDVWITRGASQGLYNAFDEGGFSHFFSPQGTQWADGSLANYASLTYTDWNSWAKGVHGGPQTTVGVNAVVHIIPDDIYLSVRFTSWTGGGGGGGFSYIRSTMVVPEPASGLLLLAGLGLLATRRFLSRSTQS